MAAYFSSSKFLFEKMKKKKDIRNEDNENKENNFKEKIYSTNEDNKSYIYEKKQKNIENIPTNLKEKNKIEEEDNDHIKLICGSKSSLMEEKGKEKTETKNVYKHEYSEAENATKSEVKGEKENNEIDDCCSIDESDCSFENEYKKTMYVFEEKMYENYASEKEEESAYDGGVDNETELKKKIKRNEKKDVRNLQTRKTKKEKTAKSAILKIENFLHMDIGRHTIRHLLQNKIKNKSENAVKKINHICENASSLSSSLPLSSSYYNAAENIINLSKEGKINRVCLVCLSPSNIANFPPLSVDGLLGTFALIKFFIFTLNIKCLIITDACNQSILHSMLTEVSDIKDFYRSEINNVGKIPLLLDDNYMLELKSYIPTYGWTQKWQENLENAANRCEAFISVHRAGEGEDGKYWLLRGLCMTQYIAPLDCVFYKSMYSKKHRKTNDKKEEIDEKKKSKENNNVVRSKNANYNSNMDDIKIEKGIEEESEENDDEKDSPCVSSSSLSPSSSSIDQIDENTFGDAQEFNKILKHKIYRKKNKKFCFHKNDDKLTIAIGCTGNELGMGRCFCSYSSSSSFSSLSTFSSVPSFSSFSPAFSSPLKFAKNTTLSDHTLVAHTCTWGCYGLLCALFILLATEKFNSNKKQQNEKNEENEPPSKNSDEANEKNFAEKKEFYENFFLSTEAEKQIDELIRMHGVLDDKSLSSDTICSFSSSMHQEILRKLKKFALDFCFVDANLYFADDKNKKINDTNECKNSENENDRKDSTFCEKK